MHALHEQQGCFTLGKVITLPERQVLCTLRKVNYVVNDMSCTHSARSIMVWVASLVLPHHASLIHA